MLPFGVLITSYLSTFFFRINCCSACSHESTVSKFRIRNMKAFSRSDLTFAQSSLPSSLFLSYFPCVQQSLALVGGCCHGARWRVSRAESVWLSPALELLLMEHAEEAAAAAAALERPSGGRGPFSNQRGGKIEKMIAIQKGSNESAASTRTPKVPIKTVIY